MIEEVETIVEKIIERPVEVITLLNVEKPVEVIKIVNVDVIQIKSNV